MAEGLFFGAVSNSEFVLIDIVITTNPHSWYYEFVDLIDEDLAMDEVGLLKFNLHEYPDNLRDEYIYTELEDGFQYLEYGKFSVFNVVIIE